MLETEIKRLNDNIERLNAMLERMEAASERNAETVKAMSQPAQQPAQQPADTPEVENEQVEDATGYTTDDIKSMALAISRKDRSKQKDIKAKLSDQGAKVATDLSGDALQAVGEWLSALKEELGA
jgi:predicted transcriptional regulator YheO